MTDELTQAQESLGKAIEQARAGEDRQLAQQVRDAGENVVRLLNGLVRLTHIHAADNHAFDTPVHELAGSLRRLDELLGQIRLVTVENQVYINDIRVRMDERLGLGSELGGEFARHGSGGLALAAPLDEPEIRTLTFILAAPAAGEKPLATVAQALRDAGVDKVTPLGPFRLRLTGETATVARVDTDVRGTLAKASGLVAEAWENMSASRVPNPLPIRRMVNDLVDAGDLKDLLEEETVDSHTHAAAAWERHAIRVTTLAISLGRELGLSDAALADLGVAAMYHDIGYAAKEDGYAPPFERHGIAAARMLLRQRGFHQAKIKRLLVAFEHHRKFRAIEGTPTLYARILHICDDFDTLTRARAGGALNGPAAALALMAGAAGDEYDPQLFQLFVNLVGAFPPGTLVKLADGRTAVSISGGRDRERFAKPRLRIVKLANGRPPEEVEEVDLAEGGAQIAEIL
jgi:hypothetical protein